MDGEITTKTILVLGKHQYMVERIQSLLQGGGFAVQGFDDVDKVTEEYKESALDMVVFTGAVNPTDESVLLTWKNEKFPDALVFHHHGGPATVLDEVKAKFNSSSK
jgi:DNA-binding NtrC family response regulator